MKTFVASVTSHTAHQS